MNIVVYCIWGRSYRPITFIVIRLTVLCTRVFTLLRKHVLTLLYILGEFCFGLIIFGSV